MTGSLSALGAGAILLVKPGQSFTYAFTVAEAEAFEGTVRLTRSLDGGQTWQLVTFFVGTAVTPLEGAAGSGTIAAQTAEARYRADVIAIAEGSDGITWTLLPAVDSIQTFTNRDGAAVLELTDEGIVSPKVTATVLVAPGELIDFSAVPTANPAVAGRLWLDTGVLKISAGLLVLALALGSGSVGVSAQARTMFPSQALLTDQAATGSSEAKRPATTKTTYQATGTTTAGAGSATIIVEVTNVEAPTADTQWTTAGTITLTLGTAEVAGGFAMDAAWRNVRARLSAISGTGAKVSVRLAGGA